MRTKGGSVPVRPRLIGPSLCGPLSCSRRGLMRSERRATFLLLAVVLAACGGGRWVGEDIHDVEGYAVGREAPCRVTQSLDCPRPVVAVLQSLPADQRAEVLGAATAALPTGYERDGVVIAVTGGGTGELIPVILDFPRGERQVFAVVCGPAIPSGEFGLSEQNECVRLPDNKALPRMDTPPPGG